MSSYARLTDNTVAEVITPPVGFALANCVHPSLIDRYTAIPDGVEVGATYDADAGTYTNPDAEVVAAPEADAATLLAAAQANKRVEINAAAQTALAALAAGYPDWEVSTWDQQLREAQLVTADNTLAADLAEGATDTIPLIRQMATARTSLGDTVAERILALAARIITNAASWSSAAGAIIGKRQAYEDAVGVATTADDVEAIVVTF